MEGATAVKYVQEVWIDFETFGMIPLDGDIEIVCLFEFALPFARNQINMSNIFKTRSSRARLNSKFCKIGKFVIQCSSFNKDSNRNIDTLEKKQDLEY